MKVTWRNSPSASQFWCVFAQCSRIIRTRRLASGTERSFQFEWRPLCAQWGYISYSTNHCSHRACVWERPSYVSFRFESDPIRWFSLRLETWKVYPIQGKRVIAAQSDDTLKDSDKRLAKAGKTEKCRSMCTGNLASMSNLPTDWFSDRLQFDICLSRWYKARRFQVKQWVRLVVSPPKMGVASERSRSAFTRT